MKRKIVRRKPGPAQELPTELHPVLAGIYAARGLTRAEELDCSLKNLLPFTALKGIERAVELLSHTLCHDKRILIVADFDADGATSCTVAMRALALMGAAEVSYISPNRFENRFAGMQNGWQKKTTLKLSM